jgi:short-subunit dehydrogenase involved in D-alanine esterification of teichoic acids
MKIQVIAIGRDLEKLQKLSSLDQRIIPFQCDISKQLDLDNLMLFLEQNHKDLNILVNNAGIQYNYHFLEETDLLGKIAHEIDVNLTAPIKLIALILPILEK